MGNILTVEGRPTAGALFSCAVLIAVTAICLDVNFTRELAARLARSAAKCPQPPHALREQLSAADPPRELGGLVRCSVLAQAKALAEGVANRSPDWQLGFQHMGQHLTDALASIHDTQLGDLLAALGPILSASIDSIQATFMKLADMLDRSHSSATSKYVILITIHIALVLGVYLIVRSACRALYSILKFITWLILAPLHML